VTSLHYGTPAQRRYQTHTARAARRVAGVFGAHLWGLGDLPTDETALTTTATGVPAGGSAALPTANDGTAIPAMQPPTTADDVTAPTYTTGLMAVGMGAVYGGAIGAVASARLAGTARGALAAGGLSAFGCALAYATIGQKAPAFGFGIGAAGAIGLAIYLAVRSRRAGG